MDFRVAEYLLEGLVDQGKWVYVPIFLGDGVESPVIR